MRLLHTKHHYFREFVANFDLVAEDGHPRSARTVIETDADASASDTIPPYAILSHRWGEDEVSYLEFLHLTLRSDATHTSTVFVLSSQAKSKRSGAGFRKIMNACDCAYRDGYKWIWIDTCCIDKNSSAELTEAINSMWTWYLYTARCYAYLGDVENGRDDTLSGLKQFRESEWFRRGWTLQELLAPSIVVFMDRKWRKFGDKTRLSQTISTVTGIDMLCLTDPVRIFTHSVSTRMTWAANRRTTRAEDMAYCLLGLFEINMPLIYGEGSRAFRRLQIEIAARHDDHTILAHSHEAKFGPFARWPRDFVYNDSISECRRIPQFTEKDSSMLVTSLPSGDLLPVTSPLATTSQGVSFRAAFVDRAWEILENFPSTYSYGYNQQILALSCWRIPKRFGRNDEHKSIQPFLLLVRSRADRPGYWQPEPSEKLLMQEIENMLSKSLRSGKQLYRYEQITLGENTKHYP